MRTGAPGLPRAGSPAGRDKPPPGVGAIQHVSVRRIRPEDGLGRKRDRAGHKELCESIRQFGVLTPITIRRAPDGSGDYLLVKGQGRTLACLMLGLETIPAVVVDDAYAEQNKVQQFLVENVARLKMRPIDRALLITRARSDGEETASVARRFGVSAATVRRLEAQLDGASAGEVEALRTGHVNLSMHSVIARRVSHPERADVVALFAAHSLSSKEVDSLFSALGWPALVALGRTYRKDRLRLLAWACHELDLLPPGPATQRLAALAERMPMSFDADEGVAGATK